MNAIAFDFLYIGLFWFFVYMFFIKIDFPRIWLFLWSSKTNLENLYIVWLLYECSRFTYLVRCVSYAQLFLGMWREKLLFPVLSWRLSTNIVPSNKVQSGGVRKDHWLKGRLNSCSQIFESLWGGHGIHVILLQIPDGVNWVGVGKDDLCLSEKVIYNSLQWRRWALWNGSKLSLLEVVQAAVEEVLVYSRWLDQIHSWHFML